MDISLFKVECITINPFYLIDFYIKYDTIEQNKNFIY